MITGFSLLAALNAGTFFVGQKLAFSPVGNSWANQILANFRFDSVGTLAGLFGSALLFVPLLIGAPTDRRKSLSIFFFSASVLVGVSASLIWDHFFGAGSISYGSSAIDIAAQAIIFTIACFALIKSFFVNPRGAWRDTYVRNAFRVIYATLIATTLWFILFLQPIFTFTSQYNWRVHEIAFLSAALLTSSFLFLLSSRRRNPVEVAKNTEMELAR